MRPAATETPYRFALRKEVRVLKPAPDTKLRIPAAHPPAASAPFVAPVHWRGCPNLTEREALK
jgi:hypothetical protein